MKQIISLITLSFFITQSVSAMTLVPSLQMQMQRQATVDKKAAVFDRKVSNRQTIASIRARNSIVRSWVASSRTPIASTQQQVTPVLQLTISPQVFASAPMPTVSPSVGSQSIPGIDMNRVRDTWISWYNGARAERWLGAYGYDDRLNGTAHDWNTVFAGSRGTNYHERTPGDGYYNYPIINQWFQARGVNPPVIAGVNHSENVSYGYYSCSQSDCTDELISAIRSSYIFFINSPVHSKSVFQPNFTKIGLDVIIVPSERRYYVTVHYMTK